MAGLLPLSDEQVEVVRAALAAYLQEMETNARVAFNTQSGDSCASRARLARQVLDKLPPPPKEPR